MIPAHNMKDFKELMKGKKVIQINLGQSGADVYDIDGEKILKHVCRDKLRENQFETYKKEALFYQNQLNATGQTKNLNRKFQKEKEQISEKLFFICHLRFNSHMVKIC